MNHLGVFSFNKIKYNLMKLFSFVIVWRIRKKDRFLMIRKFICFCLPLTLLQYLRGTLCIIRAIKIIFRKLNITQSTLKKFRLLAINYRRTMRMLYNRILFLFLTFSFSGKLHELLHYSDTQTCVFQTHANIFL